MTKSLGLLTVCAVVACAPADGPSTRSVLSTARQNDVPIVILNETAISKDNTRRTQTFSQKFRSATYRPGVVKPGDTIAITVFEAGESGLFSPSNSSTLDLGEYTVDPSGTIELPFAGRLLVGNKSTPAAQRLITDRLRESSVNPFVNVRIVRKETDSFTVQGQVPGSGQFPLSARGEKILDAIAMAGGPQGKPGQTEVKLIRANSSASQSLASIYENPHDNIPVQPGDTLILSNAPDTFVASGALGTTGEIAFSAGSLSLTQAIARAGGLKDSRANPKSVFVLRTIPPEEAYRMNERIRALIPQGGPIIYRVNLKDTSKAFLANQFMIRDGDQIYVGDAPLANFGKVFQVFSRPPELPPAPSADLP